MGETLDYRRVFEARPDAQILLDEHGTVLAATRAYLEAVERRPQQVIGQALWTLPPYAAAPESTRRQREALELMLRAGIAEPVDLPDAQPLAHGGAWSYAVNVPVHDESERLLCVLHELQTRRPADADMASGHERHLRKLFEHSYDAVALFDAYGRNTFVTPSIQHVAGYSEQEFLNLPPLAGVHPDDAPDFGRKIGELRAHPGGLLRFTFRSRHRDGQYRHIEMASVNHLHDPDVASIVSTFRDVTERVKLQEELRASNERLRLALSAAHAISWDWDLVAQRSSYSSDFGVFFGMPSAAYDGFDATSVVHPDDRELVREATARTLATGEDFEVEFRGPQAAPGVRWFASHGQLVRDAAGIPARLLGITWDISERKRLEQERELLDRRIQEGQKLESLGVLAGGIAHDFNNLLMAMLGNANLTRRALDAGSPALGYVGQIDDAVRRAADLCRQLLAYAGKGRFVLSLANLNDLIQDTTHLLEVSINKKAVLRFHLQPKLPQILADETQIRQVLMNLVINASDAIGERSGAISISTGLVRADRAYLDGTFLAPELPEDDYVYLEVSDTGVGMSPEVQARIFDPFFTTKFTGRGLGLAAVLGIVRGHRGALKVYSELGKGSCFKFLLPVARAARDEEAVPARDRPALPARGTILVVDDEESVLAVAGRMLEQLGFQVLAAGNGQEALQLFRARAQDIVGVLMDLTMPHMDGDETFRELRRLRPEIRVLLMSGYNEQDAVARFVGKGLAGFIQKPFGFEELRERLQALLG